MGGTDWVLTDGLSVYLPPCPNLEHGTLVLCVTTYSYIHLLLICSKLGQGTVVLFFTLCLRCGFTFPVLNLIMLLLWTVITQVK